MVRAVFYTGLLTLVGTGLIAYFLVEQVTTGFYQERFDQVEAEATDELIQAGNGFDAMQPVDRGEVETQVAGVLENLGGSAALPRDFVLLPLGEPEDLQVAPRHSEGFSEGVISEDLREAVLTSGQDTQLWQPVAIENEEGEDVPGVAFGIYVHLPPGEPYGLFYVYDFSSVEENVTFVFQVFLIAIAVILLMNMLIAAWITRTVVKPVSQAAEVSERIADGQLDQRLAVVGEDEIARLGLSFNRMASTLQEQITQLANLSKMQQRFVSDVSHELRTPLSTVSIAADVLHSSSEDFDPVSRRSAELLHHQVERFQALLADLLEMSRFDAGAAELALNDVDLSALAQEVLTAALPLAEQTGGELNIVVQGDDFTAEVDRRRIDRILRNLVNNAIEYSEGQPVDLVITSSPTAVGIAVRDFGIGMTPEQVDHVFDRFWRADPARARTTGGSGLGLSIATEDTRLHQGSFEPVGPTGAGGLLPDGPAPAPGGARPSISVGISAAELPGGWSGAESPQTGCIRAPGSPTTRVQEQALYQQDPEA